MNLLDWVVGILFILSELIIIKRVIGCGRLVRKFKGSMEMIKRDNSCLCVIEFDFIGL